MKPKLKAALDKEVTRNRRIWIIFVSIVILLLVIKVPFSSKSIFGNVIGLSSGKIGAEGSKLRARVILESGEIVVAKLPDNFTYQVSKNVELLKYSSLVGMPSYEVVQYVE